MWKTILFVLLTGNAISTCGADNPCNVDNGGCSHQCLSQGAGDIRCGCPCGFQLTPTNFKTCEEINQCDTDLYFLVDISASIDRRPCLLNTFGTSTPYVNWMLWKGVTTDILQQYIAEDETARTNVAVQLYHYANERITAANYSVPPALADAVVAINSMDSPICTGVVSNYMTTLALGLQANSNNSVPDPFKPRPKSSTIRVAIVMAWYDDLLFTEDQVLPIRNGVLNEFHEIIVVTQSQIVAQAAAENTRSARALACGNASLPCDKVFFIDRLNDFNTSLSKAALQIIIDRLTCQSTSPEVITYLNCTADVMIIELAACRLRGMQPTDLVFPDLSCNVSDFAFFTKDNMTMVIIIPYGACGMSAMTVNSSGVIFNVFTQVITTGNFSVNQSLLEVHVSLTCMLNALSELVSVNIAPGPNIIGANFSATGSYPLSLELFSDSVYSQPVSSPILVGCDVYGSAETTLPSNLALVLWSCWATPSPSANDAVKYYLFKDGCTSDSTFLIVETTHERVRFTFKMFEFISGFKKVAKPPVYLHCEFTVCAQSDTSDRCSQSCPGTVGKRKRRHAEHGEGSEVVTKTIGPFIVQSAEEAEKAKSQGSEKTNTNQETIAERPASTIHEQPWINQRLRYVFSESPTWSMSFYINLMLMIVAVCGVFYFRRSMNRQRQESYNFCSNRGVSPYTHCAKHHFNYQPPYQPPEGASTCRTCAELSESTAANQAEHASSEEVPPPEYQA